MCVDVTLMLHQQSHLEAVEQSRSLGSRQLWGKIFHPSTRPKLVYLGDVLHLCCARSHIYLLM